MNLTDEEKKRGVITTSAGNHSQAMAYQGGKLGVPITVVMPIQAPLVKVGVCFVTLNKFECLKHNVFSCGGCCW